MIEKLNIAEILKDCPKGTKLYSLVHGEVKLTRVANEYIHCKPNYLNVELNFNSDGRWVKNEGECILFPSKENRDWNTFQRPFKDGDVVTTKNGKFIGIVKIENNKQRYAYVAINELNNLGVNIPYGFERLATEEEKQKLFKAIKDNNYCWNAETKTLEKLVEPKFKVGDRIRDKKAYISGIITDISDGTYKVEYKSGGVAYANIKFQDDWELVPNKFDITTLKPFDKVLVRNTNGQVWTADLFSYMLNTNHYLSITFVCLGHYPNQCIPFEGNEHLLGTTNDCDEYYKTW